MQNLSSERRLLIIINAAAKQLYKKEQEYLSFQLATKETYRFHHGQPPPPL